MPNWWAFNSKRCNVAFICYTSKLSAHDWKCPFPSPQVWLPSHKKPSKALNLDDFIVVNSLAISQSSLYIMSWLKCPFYHLAFDLLCVHEGQTFDILQQSEGWRITPALKRKHTFSWISITNEVWSERLIKYTWDNHKSCLDYKWLPCCRRTKICPPPSTCRFTEVDTHMVFCLWRSLNKRCMTPKENQYIKSETNENHHTIQVIFLLLLSNNIIGVKEMKTPSSQQYYLYCRIFMINQVFNSTSQQMPQR